MQPRLLFELNMQVRFVLPQGLINARFMIQVSGFMFRAQVFGDKMLVVPCVHGIFRKST